MIFAPAPFLTRNKTAGIFGNIADRHIFHRRQITIGKSLGDGLFRRINMGDISPARAACRLAMPV